MKLRYLLPAVLLVATAGCDSILDVKPSTTVTTEDAIVNPNSARAAQAGLYDALQSTSYYGGDFVIFMDLSSDNVQHSCTFTTFADAEGLQLTADNTTVRAIWNATYRTIGRSNTLIARIPGVTLLDATESADIIGQAQAIRALAYFDLVKVWGTSGAGGGVPIRLTPALTIADVANVTRADTSAVYTQIFADLTAAQAKITNTNPSRATVRFVRALRSKVALYRQQWAVARDEAAAAMVGVSLAPTYQALFTADGTRTTEDIFRLAFTDQDAMNLGFYYLTRGLGGRREV